MPTSIELTPTAIQVDEYVAAWPTAEEAAAVAATLPVTGDESMVSTIIGGVLVAIGAALVTFGRRPRPDAG
jgi:LPXTG-motif cell wall-anchored protein